MFYFMIRKPKISSKVISHMSICFICSLFRSSASYRKASYFLIIPIFACIIVTFISAVTSDPTIKGINMLATFEWDVLLDVGVSFI